jgi:hypothetical protein
VVAVIRVHSSAWASVNASYYTLNVDDTLTKNTGTSGYGEYASTNGSLNSVGDSVEFICHKTSPYKIGLRNASSTQQFYYYYNTGHTEEVHPGGSHSSGTISTPQAGDTMRFEIITGGYLRYSLNGITQYTSINVYTGGDFILFIDADAPNGTVVQVPKFYGSGIANYNEARATVEVLPVMLTGSDGAELYCEANLLSLADAALVGSFTDWSGNERHLTASTNYPTFETNEINGKPVIRFHGTSNPLKNTAQFTIRCGWILAKYSGGATFTDYKGLLSDLLNTTILSTNNLGTNFLDYGIDHYEFRSNDRIYPASDAPAPMQVFKLIFFRFWRNLFLDGVQLGQQTNFTSTKWNGDVAFLALYSRDFCERDIRKYSKAVADAYGLTLADVYPYQADKASPRTSIQSVNFYDPPEGARISEALDDAKREFDLKFSARRLAEVKAMKAFHNSHYAAAVECIYRDYDIIPPEDVSGYIDSPYQAAGAVNDWTYAFKFKEK